MKLCLFDHPESGKRWSASVQSLGLEILCVSQFTLYTTLKGNKPDFHLSMEPTRSRQMYDEILTKLRSQYPNNQADKIKDGQFGALMEVNIVNDGPVTVNIESPKMLSQENVQNIKNKYNNQNNQQQSNQSTETG